MDFVQDLNKIEGFDPANLTKNKYHLKCKVFFYEKGFVDSFDRQRQEEMVCLIPQQSTQQQLFYMAWLPEHPEDHFELTMLMPYPVNAACRGAIRLPGKDCKEPNIFVMTKYVEDILKKMRTDGTLKKDDTVDIVVLSEDHDHVADNVPY